MRLFLAFLAILLLSPVSIASADDEELDCMTTEWKLIGANHRVCTYAYQDPKIPEITCYMSQARTGGVKGSVGLAEDPSNFALSCVRTGPVSLPEKFPKREKVFSESTNIFFKTTQVVRVYDQKREVVVYTAISRKIIDGSPFNAVSAVSLK